MAAELPQSFRKILTSILRFFGQNSELKSTNFGPNSDSFGGKFGLLCIFTNWGWGGGGLNGSLTFTQVYW